MSHLPGNPHYESSYGTLVRIEGKTMTFPESENVLRGAQVTATLALAYEQRTANLIALAQMEHRNSPAVGFSPDYDYDNIMARLGLNEGATK